MYAPTQSLGETVIAKLADFSQDSSGDPKIIVAAATEDGVKTTGQTLDRKSGTALADSAVLSIAYATVLTEAKTLSFAAEYQDSADGSTWNTAVALQASTTAATGGTGGSTEKGVVALDLNMRSLERYVRFNITPELSHTSTDTAEYAASAIFGGYDKTPQT